MLRGPSYSATLLKLDFFGQGCWAWGDCFKEFQARKLEAQVALGPCMMILYSLEAFYLEFYCRKNPRLIMKADNEMSRTRALG